MLNIGGYSKNVKAQIGPWDVTNNIDIIEDFFDITTYHQISQEPVCEIVQLERKQFKNEYISKCKYIQKTIHVFCTQQFARCTFPQHFFLHPNTKRAFIDYTDTKYRKSTARRGSGSHSKAKTPSIGAKTILDTFMEEENLLLNNYMSEYIKNHTIYSESNSVVYKNFADTGNYIQISKVNFINRSDLSFTRSYTDYIDLQKLTEISNNNHASTNESTQQIQENMLSYYTSMIRNYQMSSTENSSPSKLSSTNTPINENGQQVILKRPSLEHYRHNLYESVSFAKSAALKLTQQQLRQQTGKLNKGTRTATAKITTSTRTSNNPKIIDCSNNAQLVLQNSNNNTPPKLPLQSISSNNNTNRTKNRVLSKHHVTSISNAYLADDVRLLPFYKERLNQIKNRYKEAQQLRSQTPKRPESELSIESANISIDNSSDTEDQQQQQQSASTQQQQQQSQQVQIVQPTPINFASSSLKNIVSDEYYEEYGDDEEYENILDNCIKTKKYVVLRKTQNNTKTKNKKPTRLPSIQKTSSLRGRLVTTDDDDDMLINGKQLPYLNINKAKMQNDDKKFAYFDALGCYVYK